MTAPFVLGPIPVPMPPRLRRRVDGFARLAAALGYGLVVTRRDGHLLVEAVSASADPAKRAAVERVFRRAVEVQRGRVVPLADVTVDMAQDPEQPPHGDLNG